MPKRLIDTDLWNNEEIIESFTAEDKYFWLYLLTSPHNNICGVFKNTPSLIARDMGLHKDTIVNLLYRFESVHNLIYSDKETNEILILNWYKWNWTKSEDFIKTIEKQLVGIKSAKIVKMLEERIVDKTNKTVYRPSMDGTNTNISNNNIYSSINNNIISLDKISEYFEKTYSIYPRKVSKIQAKKTYEHKLSGLTREEAKNKANGIYGLLKKQIFVWKSENDKDGRKLEHIPYFSSWLNSNIEDSPKYIKGKK